MRKGRHVAGVGEMRGVYGVWWRKLSERDHLKYTGIDGRIILKWIYRKWEVGLDCNHFGQKRDRT